MSSSTMIGCMPNCPLVLCKLFSVTLKMPVSISMTVKQPGKKSDSFRGEYATCNADGWKLCRKEHLVEFCFHIFHSFGSFFYSISSLIVLSCAPARNAIPN
uniref:Uncharacterized protein n=1 Tax=Cacopsylla melanoneura TaxID=428564 RepID=A0A8D8Z6S0_9HEMI